MRILKYDGKSGELRIALENLEDLWHLGKVLESGDVVEAGTFRTVKINDKEEKKPMHIAITVEQVEFSKSLNRLRMLGKIMRGTPEEFIQLGKYHTIEAEPGSRITIQKQWKSYQISRLKQAEKETKKPRLRLIALDDEKALTAIVRGYGVEYGPEFYFSGSKRDEKYEERMREYFGKIMAEVDRHEERYIIAGPGFTKDNLKKFIEQKNPQLLKRISFESCSYAERSGINELFKQGIIERIMGEERLAKELQLIELVMVEINKDRGLAEYGLAQARAAAEAYAIDKLLVLDEFLRTSREAEAVVGLAEKNKAEIVIFSGESEGGARLKGLGMIAALLKFKLR